MFKRFFCVRRATTIPVLLFSILLPWSIIEDRSFVCTLGVAPQKWLEHLDFASRWVQYDPSNEGIPGSCVADSIKINHNCSPIVYWHLWRTCNIIAIITVIILRTYVYLKTWFIAGNLWTIRDLIVELILHKIKTRLRGGGCQVVSLLALYSDELSSNPANDFSFFCLKRTKINKKEARIGQFL